MVRDSVYEKSIKEMFVNLLKLSKRRKEDEYHRTNCT